MRRIAWTETAKRDLDEAEGHLSQIATTIARDMVERTIRAGRFLVDVPSTGPRIGRSHWRKWRVAKTRYLIVHRPITEGVEIGRIRCDRSNWRLIPE